MWYASQSNIILFLVLKRFNRKNNNYRSVVEKGGSVREKDYPYKSAKGQCHTNTSSIVVKIA